MDKKLCEINMNMPVLKGIVERWLAGSMKNEDFCLLDSISLCDEEYVSITEQFNLKHGVELLNNRIKFYELPGPIHERCSRMMDRLVDRAYGDYLGPFGSTSIPPG